MTAIRLLLALLFMGQTTGAWAAEPGDYHGKGPPTAENLAATLTLGKITTNPRKVLPALADMGRYLVARLKDYGIPGGDVVLARDSEKMIGLLRRGEVDLVIETPFTAFVLQDRADAEILLREWRDGAPEYHTVFFARKDSEIDDLRDLIGKTLACEDPGSTSAFFLPLMALRGAGLRTREGTPGGEPDSDVVTYSFAGSELNIAAWVARGRADAGVVSNLDWDNPEKVLPGLRRQLRVFHETEPVPRSFLLARPGLPAALKERIKQLFVGMDETAAGRAALTGLDIERYDAITDKAAKRLGRLRRLYEQAR